MSTEDEQIANALLSMGFHRDDVKWAVRVAAAEAEVERLQRVVQGVREWLARAGPYPELNGDKFAELRALIEGL